MISHSHAEKTSLKKMCMCVNGIWGRSSGAGRVKGNQDEEEQNETAVRLGGGRSIDLLCPTHNVDREKSRF